MRQKSISFKQVIVIAFIFLIGKVYATNYYVSNSGNDNASGLTKETAWKSISKVNSTSFSPGDSILFKRGDTWRESISIRNSGNSGNYIVYGAYGTGEKPRILGSEQINSWTNVSGNIWSGNQNISSNPYNISYGAQIFFNKPGTDASWGNYKSFSSDFSNLSSEYDWTWSGGTIYIYSPADPNSRYLNAECPQRENAFLVNSNGYFALDNLFVGFLVSTGVRDSYGDVGGNSVRVTNCEIAYIGVKNSSLAYGLSLTHSNSYYAFNKIHDCGRRSISINLYATSPVGKMQNVIIEHNNFYNGFHTTGVDCINSGNHSIDSIIIRNNKFEGDPDLYLDGINPNSNHIFVANQTSGDGVVSNIYVYNNLFTHMHGKGVGLETIDTAFIVNNTFYGWNPTLSNGQGQVMVTGSHGTAINVFNNIFYHNKNESSNPALMCVFVSNAGTIKPKLDYNLYYATDSRTDILEFYQSGGSYFDDEYTMSEWSSYRSDYPSNDANSPVPGNPAFKSTTNEDFSLTSTSPARGAAKPVSWIRTDILGNNRDVSYPCLGAFEYFEESPSSADIKSFTLDEQTESAVINYANRTVTITVLYETDVTSLTPSITVSTGASVTPASGVARNFSTPQIYSVTSQDGSVTSEWEVSVELARQQTTNNAPVIKVESYSGTTYKGLVYTIDASNSYDVDGEMLSFSWTVPGGIEVSSFSSSTISIMPLESAQEKTYTLSLHVTDGIASVNKDIVFSVQNLDPDALEQVISSIEASDYETGNEPTNIIDDNLNTRWSSEGDNQWITFELQESAYLSYLTLSFYNGDSRTTYFDAYASTDNANWDIILKDAESCGFSSGKQAFKIPKSSTDKSYRYIKLVGHMNSLNEWNSYTEFNVYGTKTSPGSTGTGMQKPEDDFMEIYPNPAVDNVYIKSATGTALSVFDNAGRKVYSQRISAENTQINFDFRPGFYIIQVTDINQGQYSKKLIVK